MERTLKSNLQRLGRAALFSTLAIGSMSLGLGATTYTMTLANDYLIADVSTEVAPAQAKPAVCLK